MICNTNISPNKEPKFHIYVRFIGVGRSIVALVSGLISLRGGIISREDYLLSA